MQGLDNSLVRGVIVLPSRAMSITRAVRNSTPRTVRLYYHLRRKRLRTADQVRVGRSSSGLGLFATGPFRKGEFIAQYWGRKLTEKQADPLETKYLFELNSKWTIDGSTRANTARYINHSCRPNGKIDTDKGIIVIRAKRKIQPGEEITYHYGRNYFTAFIKPHGCRCAHCKKVRKAARAAKAQARKRAARKRSKTKTR
jgi:SET domain-containing protein